MLQRSAPVPQPNCDAEGPRALHNRDATLVNNAGLWRRPPTSELILCLNNGHSHWNLHLTELPHTKMIQGECGALEELRALFELYSNLSRNSNIIWGLSTTGNHLVIRRCVGLKKICQRIFFFLHINFANCATCRFHNSVFSQCVQRACFFVDFGGAGCCFVIL